MKHLDLFSGIGGFAYATDQVWDNVEHIFCDNDRFCQQVLKRHWPESEIYDDIRQIDTNPFDKGLEGGGQKTQGHSGQLDRERGDEAPFILTGGFPCQPFSAAGLRKGTADERHLWPEMLRVIQLTKPTWVIAENVRGILTWNDGLVFEQVCSDLEASGYEVQPFIIPAVAVNAPHRRDRVWFIAHALDSGQGRKEQGSNETPSRLSQEHRAKDSPARKLERTTNDGSIKGYATDTDYKRSLEGKPKIQPAERDKTQPRPAFRPDWSKDWSEIATELCRVDDGLPVTLDGFELSKPQHRKEQLKAYGNAIVPQVALEIMKGMK